MRRVEIYPRLSSSPTRSACGFPPSSPGAKEVDNRPATSPSSAVAEPRAPRPRLRVVRKRPPPAARRLAARGTPRQSGAGPGLGWGRGLGGLGRGLAA